MATPCDFNENVPSKACPADWPVIALQQNKPETFSIQLVDNAGTKLNLAIDPPPPGDDEDPPTSPSSDPLVIVFSDAQPTQTAKIWIQQHPTDPQTVEVLGEYEGAGLFSFGFSAENVSRPGLYLASILLHDLDGNLTFVKNCFLEIEQNATDTTRYNYPLTISEIRLAMRDTCPDANYLLDDVEFSNKEIQYAMRRPIDMFNETMPAVVRYNHNNFPFRYNWTEATIGCLLETAAYNLRRNQLESSAGGVAVDDKGRWQVYFQIAAEKKETFQKWALQQQVAENMRRAFRSSPGRWCR